MKRIRTLQIRILERFLSEKELDSLMEEYVNSKRVAGRGGKRPTQMTESQAKMLKDFDSGMTFREIAKKYKTTDVKVRTAIMWAGVLRKK